MAGPPEITRKPVPRSAPAHDIEVLEKNTDTSWALFQSLQDAQERGFKKTEPAALHQPAALPHILNVEDVLLETRRNNRICPKPLVWRRLYEWLPNKCEQLARVPATREEWDELPPLEKRARLREHIEWAAVQGVLQKVHDALKALPEERWHHAGE